MKILFAFLSLFMATQLFGQNDTINRPMKSLFKAYLASTVVTMVTTTFCIDQFDKAPHTTSKLFLISIGPSFGPSIGHFYSKDYNRAALGIIIRGTGSVLFLNAFRNNDGTQAAIGSLVYLYGALYSIFTMPSSVNDYNNKYRSIAVSPLFRPRQKFVGLSVGIIM